MEGVGPRGLMDWVGCWVVLDFWDNNIRVVRLVCNIK